MHYLNQQFLTNLHLPKKDSHKGQNGKLVIIGGSKLFHGASLFALKTASRIVDMVFFSSIKPNQALTKQLKAKLYSFINIPQSRLADYIDQSNAVLIGPGMVRGSQKFTGTGETGQQTRKKVISLLNQFPKKKWLIDAGALHAVTLNHLRSLSNCLLTPHTFEFEKLFNCSLADKSFDQTVAIVRQQAQAIEATIVLKGRFDIIVGPSTIEKYHYQPLVNKTGNAGMTKGGTGDCLAGLTAALACTHDLVIAGAIGAYINGLAGDQLHHVVGPFFNADDLADQVPKTLWQQLTSS